MFSFSCYGVILLHYGCFSSLQRYNFFPIPPKTFCFLALLFPPLRCIFYLNLSCVKNRIFVLVWILSKPCSIKTLGEACPYLSVFKLMGTKRNNRIRTRENSILNYQLSSKPTVSYKPFTVYFNVICHIHFIGAKPTSVTFCVQYKIRPSFCRSICHNSGCNGVFL